MIADGRSCSFCGVLDTAPDPCDLAFGIVSPTGAHITYAWYTGKPKHNCKNEGKVCFYCYGTYQSRYKLTGRTSRARNFECQR